MTPRLPLIMIWEVSFSCEKKMLGTRKTGIFIINSLLQIFIIILMFTNHSISISQTCNVKPAIPGQNVELTFVTRICLGEQQSDIL